MRLQKGQWITLWQFTEMFGECRNVNADYRQTLSLSCLTKQTAKEIGGRINAQPKDEIVLIEDDQIDEYDCVLRIFRLIRQLRAFAYPTSRKRDSWSA